MSDKEEIFFEVMTPLGFRVRVTKAFSEVILLRIFLLAPEGINWD